MSLPMITVLACIDCSCHLTFTNALLIIKNGGIGLFWTELRLEPRAVWCWVGLNPVLVQVERDLRAGDHALAEHHKDDDPERLQSEHDEGLPSGGELRLRTGLASLSGQRGWRLNLTLTNW
jgi:hypothetical protein